MSIVVNILVGLALFAALVLLLRYELQMRRRWREAPSPVEIHKAPVEIHKAHVVETAEIRRLVGARDGEPTADAVARELARLRSKLRTAAEMIAGSADVIEGFDDSDDDGEIADAREVAAELLEIATAGPERGSDREVYTSTQIERLTEIHEGVGAAKAEERCAKLAEEMGALEVAAAIRGLP